MTDNAEGDFVAIKDGTGRVTGIMDRAMAEHIASTKPPPSQESIDGLLATVTRVRVVPVSSMFVGAAPTSPLLDTAEASDLAAFRRCFRIVEDPRSFGHCMCMGNPHFELFRGDVRVATLGYHHGAAFRWDAWKWDAHLAEPELLLEWLSSRGVDGPRKGIEDAARRAEADRKVRDRWVEAIPGPLRPFTERFWMIGSAPDPGLRDEMRAALRKGLPDPATLLLALFGWYGSGTGLLNGYPVYEDLPGELLREYPTEMLAGVLSSHPLTPEQRLGAVRLFAGWGFRERLRSERGLLPPGLTELLLRTARDTGVADTIQRAEAAFAPKPGKPRRR